jgi:hypothetical protein
MAVLSREDLMKRLNESLGEDADVSIMEDVADTYDAIADHSDADEWERRYKENDATWRKRYRDRFECGTPDSGARNQTDDTEDEEIKVKTFDELFVNE